jgi:hypothetical protein
MTKTLTLWILCNIQIFLEPRNTRKARKMNCVLLQSSVFTLQPLQSNIFVSFVPFVVDNVRSNTFVNLVPFVVGNMRNNYKVAIFS